MKNNLPSIMNTVSGVLNRTVKAGHTVTTVYRELPSGVKVALRIAVPQAEKKSDLRNAVVDLVNIGLTQKDAAFLTGMSQSYASKLLNK